MISAGSGPDTLAAPEFHTTTTDTPIKEMQ